MSIEFDETPYIASRKAKSSGTSFPTRLIIASGLAKDEKSAAPMLLAIAILALIAASVIVFFTLLSAPVLPPPTPGV
ncbi:MAG: hypothetical protein V4644_00620 [Patescibacteria group bacterium]